MAKKRKQTSLTHCRVTFTTHPRAPWRVLILASLALAIPAANATTIFSHTFNDGTGGLDGTAVDGGTGSWVAGSTVNADGVFSTAAGSATLAFAPSDGFEYILDARILNVTGNANWIGLGFANGQSSADDNNSRFITGNVVGTAWMFFRGNNDPNPNVAHNGTGALGIGNGGLNGEDWSALNFQNGTTPGSIDLRVLLDTTAGSGNWTVTWHAKLTGDTDYTTVRSSATVPVANEANYTSVGFAFSAGGATILQGQIESFSLTQVPEPSAMLLGGLGLLALLRRRR